MSFSLSHEDVMELVKASGNIKIGEYISLALANDMPKFEVLDNLTALYKQVTGVNHKNRIYELIEMYVENYGVNSKPEISEKPKRRGNGKKPKRVIYDGKEYDSVRDVAIQNEKTISQIKYALKKGRAKYIT